LDRKRPHDGHWLIALQSHYPLGDSLDDWRRRETISGRAAASLGCLHDLLLITDILPTDILTIIPTDKE
jgi:hypothetical protein